MDEDAALTKQSARKVELGQVEAQLPRIHEPVKWSLWFSIRPSLTDTHNNCPKTQISVRDQFKPPHEQRKSWPKKRSPFDRWVKG